MGQFVTVCSETFPQKRVSGKQLQVFKMKKNSESFGWIHITSAMTNVTRMQQGLLFIVLGSKHGRNKNKSEWRVETQQ